MVKPWTVFRFSEGLRFSSMLGTAGGLCVIGYGIYTYAYYHYLKTSEDKAAASSSSGNS